MVAVQLSVQTSFCSVSKVSCIAVTGTWSSCIVLLVLGSVKRLFHVLWPGEAVPQKSLASNKWPGIVIAGQVKLFSTEECVFPGFL
ncbi:MAG: hypothetical protein KTR17_03895 [Cellvibrionaceae bacterium]|nr:hypothetical protein [Cellvibrionaceae bacterium]